MWSENWSEIGSEIGSEIWREMWSEVLGEPCSYRGSKMSGIIGNSLWNAN